MVSNTHTITLGRLGGKELNRRNKFCSITKNKLTFFSVIATKPVDIVFNKTIDNIKGD